MPFNTVSFEPSDREFVRAVVRRLLGNDPQVEDVTQEALLLAFRFRASFRGDSAYRTWLYRVTWTTAMAELRRRSRRLAEVSDASASHVPATGPSALDCLIEHEDRLAGAALLASLPAKYREVLLLRLDHSEIETARRLGLSLANVKVRAHRARASLQRVA